MVYPYTWFDEGGKIGMKSGIQYIQDVPQGLQHFPLPIFLSLAALMCVFNIGEFKISGYPGSGLPGFDPSNTAYF